MFFSAEAIEQLEIEQLAVPGRCRKLQERYRYREYRHDRTYEFARHGFCRRLKVLAQALDNVFEILPPGRKELPSGEELSEAEINIQAFVINVFGAVDNLAWIYVCETGLAQEGGKPLDPRDVGLRDNNKRVRGALSNDFRRYLEGLKPWFKNLESFRHALAHRIPLYVPPYCVPDDRLPEHREIEARMNDARGRGEWDEWNRLSEEQERLGEFWPLMTHSFGENAPKDRFHPQMLVGFSTVSEIAERMLQELDL